MRTQTASTTEARDGRIADSSMADPDLWGYIRSVADEGECFASVAEAGELDVPIAACPGWDMRELVRHVGLVHLWAAANIVFPTDRWLSVNELADLRPYWPEHTTGWPDDADLVTWYRATLTNLVEVLESTPADHDCLTFLPAPSPLIMWARRQASEIAIHRYDAEAASGRSSQFDSRFAADMLDELLSGFAPRMRASDAGADRVLHVVAEDAGAQFFVTIGGSGIRTSRDGDRSDLRLTGSAADLYVMLWNRPQGPSISCEGDALLLDQWRSACQIRWL